MQQSTTDDDQLGGGPNTLSTLSFISALQCSGSHLGVIYSFFSCLQRSINTASSNILEMQSIKKPVNYSSAFEAIYVQFAATATQEQWSIIKTMKMMTTQNTWHISCTSVLLCQSRMVSWYPDFMIPRFAICWNERTMIAFIVCCGRHPPPWCLLLWWVLPAWDHGIQDHILDCLLD